MKCPFKKLAKAIEKKSMTYIDEDDCNNNCPLYLNGECSIKVLAMKLESE